MAGPRDYSTATRAALAMLSQARCYYPGCQAPIMRFIDGEPYVEYQIAHIRDAKPGNRYVEGMADVDRASFANLILLCKPHHELVDKRHPERFPIETLDGWKRSREGDAAAGLAEVGPVTEAGLEILLAQSVEGVQAYMTKALRSQQEAAWRRVEAVRGEVTFVRFQDALGAVAEVGLLSPLGIRAEVPSTGFYLRIQQDGAGLLVHLDTYYEPSVFSERWENGQSFADIMLALARRVQLTPHWPGVERWEFATAVEALLDVLVAGLDYRARGNWIANAVQLVGTTWMLSDYEAMALDYHYQIIYPRLDESDWYSHLSGKGWTDNDEVADMLANAKFLRQLAETSAPAVPKADTPTTPRADT